MSLPNKMFYSSLSGSHTMISSFRNATSDELSNALQDARDYTLQLFECFCAAGLDVPAKVPVLPHVSPPLWMLGHIAWFAEWYILREAATSAPTAAQRTSLLTKGDDWFDTNTLAQRGRWTLELPRTGAMKTYCHEVLDRALDKLTRVANDDAALYPYRLALAYEDMCAEVMVNHMQVLRVMPLTRLASPAIPNWSQGEIRFPGGTIQMGADRTDAFVFDNEKYAHPMYVPSFTMDSTLISNAQFAEFVDDGGYDNPTYWSKAGQAWLMQQERSAPNGWQRDGQRWCTERFGHLLILAAHEPVRHINLYEAQAYCMWAQRRLPTEAEWEYAAMTAHPALRWGDLWEWTASPFEPYPGFATDAYREYSQPYFVTHQTLRGASFATRHRMRSPKFRNFHLPQRSDLLAGFRTCAL